jgi:hypothetical protein
MKYFSLNENGRAISIIKRYIKITSDQIVAKENNQSMDEYYYIDLYFSNRKNHDIENLKSTYEDAVTYLDVQKLIQEVVAYYKTLLLFKA